MDEKVHKIATALQDTRLLKLAAGDMTALDAVNYKDCLTALYTKHRSLNRSVVKKNTPYLLLILTQWPLHN